MKNRDDIIEELIKKIAIKEAEIEKAAKPVMKTNCVLTLNGQSKNIRTISLDEIISLTMNILGEDSKYAEACERLGLDKHVKGEFKIGIYTVDEWIEDLKAMATQKVLKAKLDALVADKKLLESKISKERKDEKEINDLLSKYGE